MIPPAWNASGLARPRVASPSRGERSTEPSGGCANLAGVTLLAAARLVWRHRIGARGAAIAWLALVGIATMWILAVVAFLVG